MYIRSYAKEIILSPLCLTRTYTNITYRPSNHPALPWAAYLGLTNTVLKFLELGANVQAALDNDKRVTSLYLASQNGHLLILEALIQSGAEVDAQTSQGISSSQSCQS